MNQDNPYAMNQTCKVCGEPAAGFHFGAFTCEGCKSFFGRSYNNLSSISECKNNGECIINKKNRTACKACRLRKCLLVGMSKSGSRYGRRSNWFKIHCLLQEQQQQAAAMASAAHHHHHHLQNSHNSHHNVQQQQQSSNSSSSNGKTPPPPTSAAITANALSMLGHPAGYPPGLYPPRTKEELMMLGFEDYKQHPAASPSVSSPDSHNSDSSIDVNMRTNALLGRLGKHGVGGPLDLPMNKDLFLPLPFPGLGSMSVMPPPAFIPPSHLLFPGYHPALYQAHHQSLLKQSSEQNQAAAAAAAVHHLFKNSSSSPTAISVNKSNRQQFPPTTTHSPLSQVSDKNDRELESPLRAQQAITTNGGGDSNIKAAEELTKRFYLDAVLKSQRNLSPQSAATHTSVRTHNHTHHQHQHRRDHSISALVTPNSEIGPDPNKSLSSSNQDPDDDIEEIDAVAGDGDDCGEDLEVSMTPPRSPIPAQPEPPRHSLVLAPAPATTTQQAIIKISQQPGARISTAIAQDNPIDLSMKTGSSGESSISSKSSSVGSIDDQRHLSGAESDDRDEDDADGNGEQDDPTITTTIHKRRRRYSLSNNNLNILLNNNNNNTNNNNDKNSSSGSPPGTDDDNCGAGDGNCHGAIDQDAMTKITGEFERRQQFHHQNVKRIKMQITTTPLDLTTRV